MTDDEKEAALHMSIPSYGKIYHIGHRYLTNLLVGNVVVDEKMDGSQFSAMRIDDQIFLRSHGATIYPETAPKLFKDAVDYIMSIRWELNNGWIYRGEVLCKPRHNTLTYDRVPRHNLIIFDIETAKGEHYLDPVAREHEAARLDLETVPVIYTGALTNIQQFMEILEKPSFLGGTKPEGIVIKNYNQYGVDGKVLMGKYVREEFKEIHQGAWKGANPSKKDVIQLMISAYGTPQRYDKSIQHMRDAGKLVDAPQDIGPLIKEFQKDLIEECSAEIKDKLYEFSLPQILRGASGALAMHYKTRLAEKQFSSEVKAA
jgi:hypothetical protein